MGLNEPKDVVESLCFKNWPLKSEENSNETYIDVSERKEQKKWLRLMVGGGEE